MLILGIESSSLVASAAVLSEEKLIAEYTVNNAMTHSQTLMPMIDSVMKSAGKEPEELDAIAISRGPGSFTGLRIGSATAKGMGLALNKPLVEVPTLAAMAYNLYGITDRIICPIMDARRSEVYSGAYVFVADGTENVDEGNISDNSCDNRNDSETGDNKGITAARESAYSLREILKENAGPVEELIEKLNSLIEGSAGKYRGVIFLGDGVPPYRQIVSEKMTVEHSFAPEYLLRQRAAAVAALGLDMYRQGKAVPADDHAPVYLRMSQAEREAAKR
ncbi:MAG: tRNA (adenosine(37)-N6)-threonylcarbamoyltransferase complex dimerization subunit type 1 TsaB [Lachnospiraceae bacterium]|nr:tRNA (adenosine(37)-N6)-threonylcarbamoyltransferase complex dimerization subunit type 1 TsaB [Lachnospiraceae bacterium]